MRKEIHDFKITNRTGKQIPHKEEGSLKNALKRQYLFQEKYLQYRNNKLSEVSCP